MTTNKFNLHLYFFIKLRKYYKMKKIIIHFYLDKSIYDKNPCIFFFLYMIIYMYNNFIFLLLSFITFEWFESIEWHILQQIICLSLNIINYNTNNKQSWQQQISLTFLSGHMLLHLVLTHQLLLREAIVTILVMPKNMPKKRSLSRSCN